MANKSKAKPKAKPAAKPKKEAKPAAPAASKAAKKAAKPAATSAKSGKKAKPAAAEPAGGMTYYVSLVVPAQIHDAPPAASHPVAEFTSFEAAREGLLEHLVEMIEALEQRLHSARRIGSFDEYRDLHG